EAICRGRARRRRHRRHRAESAARQQRRHRGGPRLNQPRWRLWLGRGLLALLSLLVLVTILPVFESDEWWVRIWDFPRLQIAALLLIALAGLAYFGQRGGRIYLIAILSGVAALGWQAWHVARYLPLW